MLTGYSANLPSDVLLDSGVLYIGGTKIGVSRGGWKFDPAFEIQNVDFDGKHAPIKGLDRKFHGESMISGQIIEFGAAATGDQIAKLEQTSSSADTGVTPDTLTTITPDDGGGFIAAGDYHSNVRVVFERGIAAGTGVKKYAAVLFASALIKTYKLAGQDKNHPVIDVEIVGRKGMASGTTAGPTYVIELRESLPAS